MVTPRSAAQAIRKANPYRKGKRVMVANYEIFSAGCVPVLHFQAQRWEIKETLFLYRAMGRKAIAVKLTNDKEMQLP